MYKSLLVHKIVRNVCILAASGVCAPAVAIACDIDETRAMIDRGETARAIELLSAEVGDNPAHEAARMLLAEALQKAGNNAESQKVWEEVLALSQNDANLQIARRAICRLRRIELDTSDREQLSAATDRKDPFLISMPTIDWEGLAKVEDSKYLPPVLPPPNTFEVPPLRHETKHFSVYSTNERLSRVIGGRAEIYLEFMLEKLFGGRPWPLRIPIMMYTTYEDYVQHGGPQGSGGVTLSHVSGKTHAILLFQSKPPDNDDPRGNRSARGSSRGSGNLQIWKYSIESVLPHELTHAVINEFFAGRKVPQWMHEAVAGRFEQTRDHYGEAARLARFAVAGEFFRMRDLFEQEGYPSGERIELFYEQAAAVVLFLFEAGPIAMHAFLYELAEGNGHDAACAAALGIPEENAVDEFERRWMEWMKLRYVKDLDGKKDDTLSGEPAALTHPAFLPWVNELATVGGMSQWREIPLDSLEAFGSIHGQAGSTNADAADPTQSWTAAGGALRAKPPGGQTSVLLPVRMNERVPLALSCTVKSLAGPTDPKAVFGLSQLDYAMNDLRVEALAVLADNNEHQVTAILADDLAVYLDGKCTGRAAAVHHQHELAPDVDFPLALVAYGPVEIKNLKVARIEKFSDEPLVAASEVQPQGGRARTPRESSRSPEPDRRVRRRRP